jgi:hypothetical protein
MSRRTLPYCSASSGEALVRARDASASGNDPLLDTEEEEKCLSRGGEVDSERSSDEF